VRDTTIIYYSANREHPSFERQIVKNILEQAQGLPIISVTQKPMDFGKNICVGERFPCYANAFKQLAIGLEMASTAFCLAAEADCLYPPEYFRFEPPEVDRVYRYTNIWIYYQERKKAWRKLICEGAQICGRKFWLERLYTVIDRNAEWENRKRQMRLIFTTKDKYSWTSENPVISFKTRFGVSYGCGIDIKQKTKVFPYWGTAEEIYDKYFGGLDEADRRGKKVKRTACDDSRLSP